LQDQNLRQANPSTPARLSALLAQPPVDPELARLAEAWPTLPAHIKAAVMALVATAEPAVFAPAFAAAFDRFDRQRGGVNLVSLVDLRKALPGFSRAAFDAGLLHLRRSGTFTLSAAEGRHGIDPAERDAAIVEDGTLLPLVARRAL